MLEVVSIYARYIIVLHLPETIISEGVKIFAPLLPVVMKGVQSLTPSHKIEII